MILPCVYAALPNKKAETYVEMLNAIKTIVKPLGDLINEPYLLEALSLAQIVLKIFIIYVIILS